MATSTRGFVDGMANRANPAFAAGVIAVPLLALVYAVTVGPLRHLTYVHVMAGVLWTGTDLFMGLVLGPVVGGLAVKQRAQVFQRLTPKTTFLMRRSQWSPSSAGSRWLSVSGSSPTPTRGSR